MFQGKNIKNGVLGRDGKLTKQQVINQLNASVASYGNQSSDLLSKSVDWFLYEGNTGT